MKKSPRRSKAGAARPASPVAAPTRAPTYDDLLAIARLIESGSRFSEFRLRSGDIEVEVKRANGAVVIPADAGIQAMAPAGSPIAAASAASGMTSPIAAASAASGMTSPIAAASAAPGMTDAPSDAHLIRSPMVGTFYRSPEPGAPPFVEVGARVEPDTVVCIIEVMKLMNSITAGVSGVVTHVLVDNAHTVEPGQALIAIRGD